MNTHNICFRREIRKILCGYPILICSYGVFFHKGSRSKTSKARTFLGPWKFVRDMGSLSH